MQNAWIEHSCSGWQFRLVAILIPLLFSFSGVRVPLPDVQVFSLLFPVMLFKRERASSFNQWNDAAVTRVITPLGCPLIVNCALYTPNTRVHASFFSFFFHLLFLTRTSASLIDGLQQRSRWEAGQCIIGFLEFQWHPCLYLFLSFSKTRILRIIARGVV